MIVDKDGNKWSCTNCITGHRTCSCQPDHGHDKNLFRRLRPQGKPGNSCKHCTSPPKSCQCYFKLYTMKKTGPTTTRGKNQAYECTPTFVGYDFAASGAPQTPSPPAPAAVVTVPTHADAGAFWGQSGASQTLAPAPVAAVTAPTYADQGGVYFQYALGPDQGSALGQDQPAPTHADADPSWGQYDPFSDPDFVFGQAQFAPVQTGESMNQAAYAPAPGPESEVEDDLTARIRRMAEEAAATVEREEAAKYPPLPEIQAQYNGSDNAGLTNGGGEMEMETPSQGEDSGEFSLPGADFDADEFKKMFWGWGESPDFAMGGLLPVLRTAGLIGYE